MKIKASEIEDWSTVTCSFMPHGDGTRASYQTWGRGPSVGTVIGLRAKDGRGAAYRVIERVPGPASADYDGVMVRLQFIPGRDIEDDKP